MIFFGADIWVSWLFAQTPFAQKRKKVILLALIWSGKAFNVIVVSSQSLITHAWLLDEHFLQFTFYSTGQLKLIPFLSISGIFVQWSAKCDFIVCINMEQFGNTYQNAGGSGGSGSLSEPEFQKLAQTIGTNIQKILQNGKKPKFYWSRSLFLIYVCVCSCGWPAPCCSLFQLLGHEIRTECVLLFLLMSYVRVYVRSYPSMSWLTAFWSTTFICLIYYFFLAASVLTVLLKSLISLRKTMTRYK